MEEYKYAVFAKISCAENKNAIGKAPFNTRSLSNGTFSVALVKEGKAEGFTRKRSNANIEERPQCRNTNIAG
jgi:hypothetical protein